MKKRVKILTAILTATALSVIGIVPVLGAEMEPLYAEGNVPFANVESEDPSWVDPDDEQSNELLNMFGKEGPDESYEPFLEAYPVENSAYSVVIFPGGGYFQLSYESEGTDIAKAYNEAGISAFVVKYRIAPSDYRGILADGQRAVRYVRYHADDYKIDPDKIAVCGFSQGGHLALMTCEHPDYTINDENYTPDEIDEESSMPNACITGYGVVTLEKEKTFEIGAQIFTHCDDSLRDEYSAEKGISDDMCPVFSWLCADDPLVPPENSFLLANACEEKNIPYELHVFQNGGHGIGLAEGLNASAWLDLSVSWLENLSDTNE